MSGFIAGAVIVGAGAYLASKEVSKGARQAAEIQAAQQQKGLEAQQAAIKPFEPYMLESTKMYEEALKQPLDFKTSPGYLFRLQEGLKAAGIAPGSPYLTGAQIKAAERYGQDYASAEYQNYLNQRTQRLNEIAGLGQVAAQNYAPIGQTAANVATIYSNIGQTLGQGVRGAAEGRAAGIQGATSAIGGGLYNVGLMRMYQQQQRPPPYLMNYGYGYGY